MNHCMKHLRNLSAFSNEMTDLRVYLSFHVFYSCQKSVRLQINEFRKTLQGHLHSHRGGGVGS